MFRESEITPIAARMQNGIDRFIQVIVERGFDEQEANMIYQVMRDLKVLKFDYGADAVSVKHGGLLDKEALDRALELAKNPNNPAT